MLTDVAVAMGFLVAAGVLWLATSRLPGPPAWSVSTVFEWVERQPVSAAFRLCSTVATLVALYVAIGTLALAVAAGARALGRVRVASVAERLAAPSVRRLVAGLIGLGLAVAPDRGAAVAGPPPSALSSSADPDPRSRSEGTATLRLIEPARTEPATPVGAEPDAAPEETWTIQPGDHLWALARQALADNGRDADDTDIAAYVLAIVEQNRTTLVDPDHPDLVFPGQVFTRPPLP